MPMPQPRDPLFARLAQLRVAEYAIDVGEDSARGERPGSVRKVGPSSVVPANRAPVHHATGRHHAVNCCHGTPAERGGTLRGHRAGGVDAENLMRTLLDHHLVAREHPARL